MSSSGDSNKPLSTFLQVDQVSAVAKERVDLAKALIRAVDKPAKTAKAKAEAKVPKTGTEGDGEATAA